MNQVEIPDRGATIIEDFVTRDEAEMYVSTFQDCAEELKDKEAENRKLMIRCEQKRAEELSKLERLLHEYKSTQEELIALEKKELRNISPLSRFQDLFLS